MGLVLMFALGPPAQPGVGSGECDDKHAEDDEGSVDSKELHPPRHLVAARRTGRRRLSARNAADVRSMHPKGGAGLAMSFTSSA
jgi:hypothetical protein